jgi:hypothetical protein
MDLTDPDPQHCYKHLPIALVGDVNLLVRLVNDLRERKYRNKETNRKGHASEQLPSRRDYACVIFEAISQYTWSGHFCGGKCPLH